MKFLLKFWPILLIIVFTFILRIHKIEELFYFTYDESIPAFVGRRLILWHHIPLIGGVTPFGFHLAPYFYWFYALLLFIGKFNPLIWGFASAAIACATTLLIYKVGEIFESKKVGFLAGTFWAFSYLTNVYDRHLWALYWGPLVSLIVLLSLYKIIKGNLKFVYPLAITLALSIHADPSSLVFVVLSVLVWIIYKLPLKKMTFLGIAIILFSFLPLIIFDLRHNFANTKPVLNFINAGQNKPALSIPKAKDNALLFPRTFSRLIYTQGDSEVSKQYSYCLAYAKGKLTGIPWYVTTTIALFLIYFIIWSFRAKRQIGWQLTSLLLLLYFIGIQIYGTIFKADIFEHYITGTFALFILIFAKAVSALPKKVIFVILAIFVAVNLYKVLNAKNELGLKVKRQAIEFTMQKVRDKPFSLDSLSTCWRLNGYRYLFAVFGREPVKSYVDPNFAYLYETTPVWEEHPLTVVAFVAHDFIPETKEFYKRYALLKSHEKENATFGNLEVIIMDNSTSWFDQPQN